MLAQPDSGGNIAADDAYTLVAVAPTSRVTSDNTVQDIIQVTARSQKYGVTFTWFETPQTWRSEAAVPAITLRTEQVNQICAADHVIGFRTTQDQNASRLLVNYAVISVGTDDGALYDETQVEMDRLGLPAAFQAVADTWKRLVANAGEGGVGA